GWGQSRRVYTGCQSAGKPISQPCSGMGCESLIPGPLPTAVSPASSRLNRPGALSEMDSFELNKILGAVLGTCIFVLVTSFAAQAVFSPKLPEKPGFEIAV